LRDGKKLEREIAARLETVETEAADYLVRNPMTELKEKYRDYPRVMAYLDGVREHILKNLQRFKGEAASPADRWPGYRSANRRGIRFCPTASTFLSITAKPRGRRSSSKPTPLIITCSE